MGGVIAEIGKEACGLGQYPFRMTAEWVPWAPWWAGGQARSLLP